MNFRLSLALLFLLTFHTAFAAAPANPGDMKPASRETISCLSANVDGEMLHRDLSTPIKASDRAQVRLAFLRWAQELSITGSNEKARGAARKMADDFALSLDTTARAGTGRGDYVVGGVCYVLLVYCDPSCHGNGCAIAKFYYQ